ncbi:putative nuclease HARBI1 [Photinus pyralis]|uniref:putative nuclease HARBI1 n=1 Tax=Photinus pyralis TaxID=7054 RepID=UPI0012675F7D|nr:putative nuclease HARBI1 [Photinus pyralis]
MIWYLANMESIRSVANRFAISTVKCGAWSDRVPSQNAAQIISNNFQRRFGMIGVIGAINGSYVRIIAPRDHHTSYINRKGYHSVLLQGVCAADMLFTAVNTGFRGSVHDSTLFKRSDLYHKITTGGVEMGNLYWIGDKAYSLHTYLERQKNYNLVLER